MGPVCCTRLKLRKIRVVCRHNASTMSLMHDTRHYQLVAQAIQWLVEHQSDQPDLAELAQGMYIYRLQRNNEVKAGKVVFVTMFDRKFKFD